MTPTRGEGVHPVAWWVWALLLAAVASRSTNPWVSAVIALGAASVAVSRRSPNTQRVLGLFCVLALIGLGVRLVTLIIFGSGTGSTVLLELPLYQFPAPLDGLRLGGPLTWESLEGNLFQAGQLFAVMLPLGAASELAPPRRVLRHLPASLYEVGTAVVVGVTFAPQLAEQAHRVRQARVLRGQRDGGLRSRVSLAAPVLDHALDQSLALARSMECRGFARSQVVGRGRRNAQSLITLCGMAALLLAVYLIITSGGLVATLAMLVAIGLLVIGLLVGDRSPRTRYRPQPWRTADTLLVLAGGIGLAAAVQAGADPAMTPTPGLGLTPVPVSVLLGLTVTIAAGFVVGNPR